MAELATAVFPKSVPATLSQVEELRKSGKITGTTLFVIPNLRARAASSCATSGSRRRTRYGNYYVPWTLYAEGQKTDVATDGAGRSPGVLEADGATPQGQIMVHEGAKTAAFVDGLLNDPLRKARRRPTRARTS